MGAEMCIRDRDNANRWMQLVAKYGEPDIAGLAEIFNMRVDA